MRRAGFPAGVHPNAIAIGVSLILAGVLLVLAPGALRLSSASTQPWRGYHVLLIRGAPADARDRAAVVHRFGPAVVADTTAQVEFWDFTGIAKIPVASLSDRLDAQDPRFDRYMEGLSGYFRQAEGAQQWSLLYVPATLSAARTYLELCATLGIPWRGSWQLVDFRPGISLVAIACLAAFALFLSFSLEKSRRTGAAISAAVVVFWLPFLLSGGVARLALCLALVGAWFPVMRVLVVLHAWDERLLGEARQPILVYGCVAIVGIFLLAITEGASLMLFLGFFCSLLASVVLLAGVAQLWGRLPRSRRRRSAFDPIPIVRPTGGSSRGRSVALFAVVIGIIAVGLLPLAAGRAIPTPQRTPGVHDYSWRSLATLARQNHPQSLPDVSDLVTHEAYQESLAFGRPWELPGEDERVYEREYLIGPGGDMLSRLRTVKVFDATWLASVLRGSRPGSLESLLLAQGRPVAVVLRGPSSTLLREMPLSLLVMAALLMWMARDRAAGPLIRSIQVRFNGAARRNQVP